MTKVSGAYESVVRGVSQQVPQDRLSGQHTEQVNMVSDPVHGLARRHGSITVSEAMLPHNYADLLANTAGHRAHKFSVAGAEYDLLYRSGIRDRVTDHDDTLFCYARDESRFLPVVIHDTIATQALRHDGVSALCQVGRFLLLAGNGYDTTWTTTPLWETGENQSRLAVWLRGGAYSRTFKVTLTDRLTGDKTVISYTTKSASFPDLLDTTDLLTSDPDYQKKVNDRVNDYNSKVTSWIGEAAADIVPSNIATKLKEQYDALGFAPATVVGSTLIIEDAQWGEVAVDDGGDNSLVEAVGNVIEAAEGACPVHYTGKVVKVRPSKESPETAFYLQAYPKDGVASGITEVVWREGTAATVTPQRLFVVATVEGGTLYVSDSIEWLEGQIGPDTADDIPRFSERKVGDDISCPVPNFFGKRIDALWLHQDRLHVAAGPIVTASRRGDYFNFFRASVLTLKDDDPYEDYSLGSEEDVIKYAIQFNQDCILFGLKGQYMISGRVVQTPKTASIVSISRYESTVDAAPKASGNYVFYPAKKGPPEKRVTALFQMQPAALSNNPESPDVSQQLDNYIQGTVLELVTLATPNTAIIRTDASRNGFYLYNYLDRADNGQRVLDAWHRWNWAPLVGSLMGLSISAEGAVLAYLIRQGSDGAAWIACERLTLSGAPSDLPHMDALRSQDSPGSLTGLDPSLIAKAFGGGAAKPWLGNTLEQIAANPNPADYTGAWMGVHYDSYTVPTNPFPKDRNGKTITFGRMTLGTVKVSLAYAGGCVIASRRNGVTATVAEFNGFRVGSPAAVPGTQPILTATVQGYIGGEVRESSYSIASKRWLPLTITAIEWTGQLFNRQRSA